PRPPRPVRRCRAPSRPRPSATVRRPGREPDESHVARRGWSWDNLNEEGRYQPPMTPIYTDKKSKNFSLLIGVNRRRRRLILSEFLIQPVMQHFLYFFPDPHGHGSFRPTGVTFAGLRTVTPLTPPPGLSRSRYDFAMTRTCAAQSDPSPS